MKVELAHDILAQKVYERVSTDQKRIREVERLIKQRFQFLQGEPKLSSEEVDYIRPYLSKVHITEEEKAFVEKSWRRQNAQRIRRLLIWIIVLLLFLILLGGGIFLKQALDHGKEMAAARDSIEQAYDTLQVKNFELDEARKRAEDNADEAKRNQKKAEEQERIAKRQREIAILNARRAKEQEILAQNAADLAKQEAERANTNAEIAEEKRIEAEIAQRAADSLRLIAEEQARAVNLLIAQQLAEQSLKVTNDDRLKGLLAREGYRIYKHFRVNRESGQEYAGEYNTPIYQAMYGALSDSLRDMIQYAANPPGSPPSQVRTILVQNGKIYSLTTNGRTQQWRWDGENTFLEQIAISKQPDSEGIYYDLALPAGVPTGLALNDQTGAEVVLDADSIPGMQRWVSAHEVRLVGYDAPDQARLIATQDSIFTWNDPNGAPVPLSALPTPGKWKAIAQHPNGKLLAGVDGVGTLHYWRPGAKGEVVDAKELIGSATVLAFHPQKEIIAYGTRGGNVGMYNAYSDRPVNLLRGHRAGVTDISFSKLGEFLASSSRDRSVQLWHLSDPNYLRNGPLRMDQEQGMVMSLAFSPDTKALIAGDVTGMLRTWPLDMSFWFKRLTDDIPAGEKLTRQEVVRFISTQEDFENQGLGECLTEYSPFPQQ